MSRLGEVAVLENTNKYGMKSKTIVKKDAYKNRIKPVKDTDSWTNQQVVRWLLDNRNMFENGKHYQINFLHSYGWRSGKRFSGNHIDYPIRKERYGDETDEMTDEVYGIQIITIQ